MMEFLTLICLIIFIVLMLIDDLLFVKKLEKALKTLEEKIYAMLLNEREKFIQVYQNLQQSLKELEDEIITIIKYSQKEKYDLKKSVKSKIRNEK